MDMGLLAKAVVEVLGVDKVREILQPLLDFCADNADFKVSHYCYRMRISGHMHHRVRPQ